MATLLPIAILLGAALPSQSLAPSPPFANLSPIAFGTLNPSYDDSPSGIANLLDALPRGALIDTAEKYGANDGDAERTLGAAVELSGRTFRHDKEEDPDLLICSKFAPKPWRLSPDSVVDACKASMQRLGVDQLHLYQLHYSDAVSQPLKLFGVTDNKDAIYWEGLARCYNEGLVKHTGVCNYGPQNVRAAYEFFSKRNVPLVSNQINFNLMRYRSSLETKEACDELGIGVLGYHPLGGGVLSGAYDDEWFSKVPGGLNGQRSKATRVKWYQTNSTTSSRSAPLPLLSPARPINPTMTVFSPLALAVALSATGVAAVITGSGGPVLGAGDGDGAAEGAGDLSGHGDDDPGHDGGPPTNNNEDGCDCCNRNRFGAKRCTKPKTYCGHREDVDAVVEAHHGSRADFDKKYPRLSPLIQVWQKDDHKNLPGGKSKYAKSASAIGGGVDEREQHEAAPDDAAAGDDAPEDDGVHYMVGREFDRNKVPDDVVPLLSGGRPPRCKGNGALFDAQLGLARLQIGELRFFDLEDTSDERASLLKEHIVGPLTAAGYTFLTVRRVNGTLIYLKTPEWTFGADSPYYDTCPEGGGPSLRSTLDAKMTGWVDYNLAAKEAERQRQKEEDKQRDWEEGMRLMQLPRGLGTWDTGHPYHCLRHEETSDRTYQIYKAERDQKRERQLQMDRDFQHDSPPDNKHVTTASAIISHAAIFEKLLEIEAKKISTGRGGDEQLIEELEELEQLEGLREVATILTRDDDDNWGLTTFPFRPDRTNTNKFLVYLTRRLITMFSKACYYCGEDTSTKAGATKNDQLNHGDEYEKHDAVSNLLSVGDAILESFKTYNVCSGCHRKGAKHDEEYDERLARRPRRVYPHSLLPQNEKQHRTVTETLDLPEVQFFIHEGKACGGFSGRCELKTLEVLVEKVFDFDASDVIDFTEETYNKQHYQQQSSSMQGAPQSRRKCWNRTFTHILIKLAGKCPGGCGRCFLNRSPHRRGGVELNHLNQRRDNDDLMAFKHAATYHIDMYVEQLRAGNADVIEKVRDVAERRGKSPAQVAINWGICKGVTPLCGARNEAQIFEAVRGATGPDGSWRLTESEMNELDEASFASAEYAMGFELV
ncbi:hypothetical protein ACHAXT_013241 [Thalassiosira profunda]